MQSPCKRQSSAQVRMGAPVNLDKFLNTISKLEPDLNGCLIWPQRLTNAGYGQPQIDGEWILAHRKVLEIKLGRKLALGMCACHTCDVRACVNPDHLWEGTIAQNNKDMMDKNRWVKPITKGYKHSPEMKKRLAEYCRKLSESRRGQPGRKATLNDRLKMSLAAKMSRIPYWGA